MRSVSGTEEAGPGGTTRVVNAASRAWLYVRFHESVRIVIDGGNVVVYGPGTRFNRTQFPDEMGAALHHAGLEDALIREGWTLEHLTTERRSGHERRAAPRGGPDRRRSGLRLVTRSE